MDNTSILDQIIDNQKAEEVARLDAVEIIDGIFSNLSERERDVLIRRYGLHGQGKETLEAIGSAHKLTRERIRQIETSSIKKLQHLGKPSEHIGSLRKVIYQLIEEHGGLMEKSYLLNLLAGYSVNGLSKRQGEEDTHKNYLNFLITKLLHDEFEEVANHKHFKESYRFKFQDLAHFEELLEELLEAVKEAKRVMQTKEIIERTKTLNAYGKHREKLSLSGSLDVARVLKFELFEEDHGFINSHKIIFSLLKAAKRIDQNKFGHWGAHNWREIRPKTINDKIYLVLKNERKPMHFSDIANAINQIAFDGKKANSATVHNELILDEKYVLVGRGLYGLKEWGYKDGTVSDVIEEVLGGVSRAMTREEIIREVLERRMVKKATIILALMNRDKFSKIDGKYLIKA